MSYPIRALILDRRARDPIFRFAIQFSISGSDMRVEIVRSNFPGPAFQFPIRFLISCAFPRRNAKKTKKLDRPRVGRGTIQFFCFFNVSPGKRTQNQRSDRKLERRARKIGSRDFGKIGSQDFDVCFGPETENWITRLEPTSDYEVVLSLPILGRTLRTLDFRTRTTNICVSIGGSPEATCPFFSAWKMKRHSR